MNLAMIILYPTVCMCLEITHTHRRENPDLDTISTQDQNTYTLPIFAFNSSLGVLESNPEDT